MVMATDPAHVILKLPEEDRGMMEAQDFRVRAYMVSSTATFLQDTFGEAELARILKELSPAARSAATSLKPADWCAVGGLAEFLRALAAKSNGDPEQARDRLIACGEFIAREATNTFLKI